MMIKLRSENRRQRSETGRIQPIFAFLFVVCLSFVICDLSFALTLKESIDLAYKNNPQVIGAQKRLNISDARLNQARSAFLPTVTLDGTIGKSYMEPMTISIPGMPTGEAISTTPDEASTLTSYTFTLRQLLFSGGKAYSGHATAYCSYLMSKEDLRRTRINTGYNVASAYYNAIKAERAYSLTKQRVSTLNRYVSLTKLFYDSGLATKADLLRVQTELSFATQQEILAESAMKISKISFNSLIGAAITSDVSLFTGEALAETGTIPVDKLLDEAYEKRPDWISVKLGEEISKAGITFAYSGFWPSVSFIGSWGNSVTEYPEEGSKYDLDSWKALVTGTWTLFDGLYTPNKVYESNANLEAIQEDMRAIKDSIAVEVTSSYYELEAARKRVNAATEGEELARKLLHFAELNYESRIGTSLSVLDAELAYHKAETDLLSANYDLELAKAKLKKAVGSEII